GFGVIANFPLASDSDTRLVLRNVTFYLDRNGLEHVLGQVVNVSNATATGVNVTATFLGVQGNTIQTTTVSSVPPTLSPGQVGIFDVAIDATTQIITAFRLKTAGSFQ